MLPPPHASAVEGTARQRGGAGLVKLCPGDASTARGGRRAKDAGRAE